MTTQPQATPIPDQAQREQALDPTRSFIVQAPAGSGKTELLIQRILVLLAQAQQPEEILAISFTRKAAAEMRERLLKALQRAISEPEPSSAYAKKTWQLAQAVLAQDTLQQWHLLDNPERIRIQTIDSFCHGLVQQLPLLSRLGPVIQPVDDATPLYRQAIANLFADLEQDMPWTTALSKLLLHLDNHYDTLERLLVGMLARREQWLPYVIDKANNIELRHSLEQALANLVQDQLHSLVQSIPLTMQQELFVLLQYAARNLIDTGENNKIANCHELSQLPGMHLNDLFHWQGIAELLLTQQGEWRKQVRAPQGFPAPGSKKTPLALEQKMMKSRMEQFLTDCQHEPEFLAALQAIATAPPLTYDDQQWQTVAALLQLLPVLVAHLNIVFQTQHAIDYSEITQRAQHALGDLESPTELALRLDYRLQHILVDEFQDTAITQFHLLELLTAGWQAGDGRTLFLVGDPMQSIYRFRKAEVGLFLRAREQGIGAIQLQSLVLSSNFRATAPLVNWFNQTFSQIFPTQDDLSSGAICYSPAVSTQPSSRENSVVLHPQSGQNEHIEALKIVRIIQASLQDQPTAQIAILVRNRQHAQKILAALQQAKIAYRAPELAHLAQQAVIQDLLALTCALLYPADQIAWLTILRAPWCGLTLLDLHSLLQDSTNKTIWELIKLHPTTVLTDDGRIRLARLQQILEPRLAERGRLSLRLWIENTWFALGGPACLHSELELTDARRFLQLLDSFDNELLPTRETLTNAVAKLYAATDATALAQVEIMTIHKAKGLEFDVVILPGIGRRNRQDDPQLLLWLERPNLQGGMDLLFAPIKATREDVDPIYNFLRREETIKARHEITRLLYVATTRARHQLHLLGHVDGDLENMADITPPAGSLLETLWPVISAEYIRLLLQQTELSFSSSPESTTLLLERLPRNWQHPFSD